MPQIGNTAPGFALATLDGTRTIQLSDYYGQAVLLYFWTVNCSPCVKELSAIQKFYAQQLPGKQVSVLAVDLDQVGNFVQVATGQQHLGLTYQILVDDHFQARSSYQIANVPRMYFLDLQHIIRAVESGLLSEAELHQDASKIAK
jgi:cytochrome c biogenesis protein CcmG, thiol:disulfide interchange protein DsbE